MQKELARKALVKIGLTSAEIEVYVLLAFGESSTVKQISQSLNITRQKVYYIIRCLKKKRLIRIDTHHGKCFYAEPIDQILRLYADIKNKEAKTICENKAEILREWKFVYSQ